MKLARGWPANKIRSGVFMEGTTTQNLLPHFHREHPQQVLLRKEETKKMQNASKGGTKGIGPEEAPHAPLAAT